MVDRTAAARVTILGQIYDLAREQRDALEIDHLERFQELLDERDQLIARLTALQNGDDDGAELPRNIVAFPGASDAASEDEMALDTVIRGILKCDSENEATLSAKMDEIREALPELALASRAAERYRIAETAGQTIDRPA